jgi:hypothetical protein
MRWMPPTHHWVLRRSWLGRFGQCSGQATGSGRHDPAAAASWSVIVCISPTKAFSSSLQVVAIKL